jgi:hypothetical protein
LKFSFNNKDGNNNISGGGSNLQLVHKSHPDAYHKSRILDDEIAKSKSLKSYSSNDSSLNNLDFNSFLQNVNKGELIFHY